MGVAQFEPEQVHHHDQQPSSLDVLQELVPHADVLVGSLDQSRQVSHRNLPVVVELHYADLRPNRCDWKKNTFLKPHPTGIQQFRTRISGNLWSCSWNGLQQCALSRVREADQADISDQLQIERHYALLALNADEVAAREAATPASCGDALLARLVQFADLLAFVGGNCHADRNFDYCVRSPPAMEYHFGAVFPHSTLHRLRFYSANSKAKLNTHFLICSSVTGSLLGLYILQSCFLVGHEVNAAALTANAAVFRQTAAPLTALNIEPQAIDEAQMPTFRQVLRNKEIQNAFWR